MCFAAHEFEYLGYWISQDDIQPLTTKIEAIKNNKPFKRCYSDIAETFRSKPTGNRVLGFVCSYCPYKLPCWGRDKLQLLPQQQSKGKNPKWVWYTAVTNPREETEEFNGG